MYKITAFTPFIHCLLYRVNFVVGFGILPQICPNTICLSVNVDRLVVLFGGGGDTSLLCCNQTCLIILHSGVVGTQKPSFEYLCILHTPSHTLCPLHPSCFSCERWRDHLKPRCCNQTCINFLHLCWGHKNIALRVFMPFLPFVPFQPFVSL